MNARKRNTTVVSMQHALIPLGPTIAPVSLDFREMDGLAKISMNARKRSTTVVSMQHALIPSGPTIAPVSLDFREMDGLAKI